MGIPVNLEKRIAECTLIQGRMASHDPDPFYMGHLFCEFLGAADRAYDGIFGNACEDLGIFVEGGPSRDSFCAAAELKGDAKALEFLRWFDSAYSGEHEPPYPNFVMNAASHLRVRNAPPPIRMMLMAGRRYRDDPFLEIRPKLSGGRIASAAGLEDEIALHSHAFLHLVNRKRDRRGEPKVGPRGVRCAAFADVGGSGDVEVSYASHLYVPVLRRIAEAATARMAGLVSR